VNIVKEQYKQIQKIYITKVKELEDNLFELNEKNLENKKPNIDNKDFKNEISKMKRKQRMLEDSLMKFVFTERGLFNKNKNNIDIQILEDKYMNKFHRFNVKYNFFYFNFINRMNF
jgi:hypothetical protein